jgi:hypothetical protein
MNKILLFTSLIVLVTASGCLVSDGGRRGYYRGPERHEHFESHADVVVAPPVVVLRPPEIIVR